MLFDVINLQSSDKNNQWGKIVLKGLIFYLFLVTSIIISGFEKVLIVIIKRLTHKFALIHMNLNSLKNIFA